MRQNPFASDSSDVDLFCVLDGDGEIAGVGGTPADAMYDYVKALCDVLLDPAELSEVFAEGPWRSAEEMLVAYCTGVEIRQLSSRDRGGAPSDDVVH